MSSSRNDRRNLLTAALIAALAGFVLFGWMFGFDLPLAGARFWTAPKGDMAVMTTGYEALLREPWGLPLTLSHRLGGEAIAVVYTDSIPWIALALKASGVGQAFNPLGVFLLLSYLVQGPCMALLLWNMGVRRLAPLAAGALLALMLPAWITRQFGHIALSGHFILVLGLALSIDIARQGLTPRRILAFAGLAAFTVGVHAYHLPPLGLMFVAAMSSVLLQRGWKALGPAMAAGVGVAAAVILPALLLGYATGGGGASQGAGALGFYSMNLLGPVEPQASGLMGHRFNGEWFSGSYDPTGGQAFEGFNYLGAGILLLIALAAVVIVAARLRPSREQVLRFAPFVLLAVALAAISIGPVVYAHDRLLLRITLKQGTWVDVLALFRSHGRFFWAVGYLALACAVALLASRLRPRTLLAILALALVLQAVDTMPPRQGVRETFREPWPLPYPASWRSDARLDNRAWVMNPTFWCLDDRHAIVRFDQMVLLAIRHGGEVNSVYTAREAGARECGYPSDLLHDAGPGDRRITVILDQKSDAQAQRLQAFAARGDCYRLQTNVICGRDLALPGLIPLARGELRPPGSMLLDSRFDTPARPPSVGEGWSPLDPGGQGIWSNARVAVLNLPAPVVDGERLGVDLTMLSYTERPGQTQQVTVRVDGQTIQRLDVEGGAFATYRMIVPARLVKQGRPIRLELDLPDAHRPSNGDPRLLGVALQRLRLSY